MERKTITLPEKLTAANSKNLLYDCIKQLNAGELCVDGSNLTYMDYSGDAFFALLAETSEKTGNKLTLAHFNNDIKTHLQHLKKQKVPVKVKVKKNFLEDLGEKTLGNNTYATFLWKQEAGDAFSAILKIGDGENGIIKVNTTNVKTADNEVVLKVMESLKLK